MLEQSQNSLGSIVFTILTIDNQSAKVIYTNMYDKSPTNKFMIAIEVPHEIWARYRINTMANSSAPTIINTLGINAVNGLTYTVSLDDYSSSPYVASNHHFSAVWMFIFDISYYSIQIVIVNTGKLVFVANTQLLHSRIQS